MGLDILFIIKAIIIAIVEGLTEFIPVSSTGHMILVGSIINFKGDFARYVWSCNTIRSNTCSCSFILEKDKR